MIKKETTIKNKEGFHIRPAQIFSNAASKFESDVVVLNKDGNSTNGKSTLGLMALGFETGSKIILEISGKDEIEAGNELINIIDNKFGED
ncbi:MAG: HPr family phosphocarrier protein [Clostridiales bacterium]